LLYGLLLVAATVVLIELVYAQSPIPPGVDSGNWIQRSFGWVGLAHPPFDAVGSPYSYSPMIFPIIGLIELNTRNPSTTGFVLGGFLLAVYGLSLVYLGRRFFVSGPFQLLFVGLGILNGTVLQMLFWSGYPNLLGLALLNVTVVALLGFLRSRSTTRGLALYGAASLIFLTHELTFVIFVAALAVVALLLIAEDRRWFAMIFSSGNLLGLLLLGSVVVGYVEITRHLAIATPGYIGSNPAAFYIDNIGEYFRPLGSAPIFFPMEGAVTMSPLAALVLLGAAALLVMVGLALLAHYRPALADLRAFIAAALMIGTLLVPVGGYLVHVDTDYTRFVYFVPLPLSLLLTLTAERAFARRWIAQGAPSAIPPASPQSPTRPPTRRRITREGYATGAIVLVLVLILTNVTIPVALAAEKANTGTSHDSEFLAATSWLANNPQPGSVLTTQGAVRWAEALTDRGAFDIGPTWLLFDPWQIVNAEETYWALNSAYAFTNNLNVLAYSGFNLSSASSLSENPMYGAYVEGIQFPLIRFSATGLSALASPVGSANATWVPAWGTGSTPVLSFPNGTPDASVAYSTADYTLFENGTVPSVGPSWVNLTVVPLEGATVAALNVSLQTPPTGVSLLHTPTSAGVSLVEPTAAGTTLDWSDTAVLGQLPGAQPISSTIQVAPGPTQTILSNSSKPNSAFMEFQNPAPTEPFTVTLAFSTAGVGNPAVKLPSKMFGSSFLAVHNIHFLLIPNQVGFAQTENLYRQVYHFSVAFHNPEWVILQG
jgi:hypothetical protein